MPLGRPKRIKTFEDYFKSQQGGRVWRDGSRLFHQSINQPHVKDGVYQMVIIDILFERRTWDSIPYLVFSLVSLDGSLKFNKYMAIDMPEGVANLLTQLEKLGFYPSLPSEFNIIPPEIREKKIAVNVMVESHRGYQSVKILSVLDKQDASVALPEPAVEVVPVPALEPKEEPIVESIPIPEPIPAIKEAPAKQESKEVDIQPGDGIRIELEGQKYLAIVHKVFEEENELIVIMENGEKKIISGDNIIALISNGH